MCDLSSTHQLLVSTGLQYIEERIHEFARFTACCEAQQAVIATAAKNESGACRFALCLAHAE